MQAPTLDERLAGIVAKQQAARALSDNLKWQVLSSIQLECSFLRALLLSSSSSSSCSSSNGASPHPAIDIFGDLLVAWSSLAEDASDAKSRELCSSVPLLLLESVLSVAGVSEWPQVLSLVEGHRRLIRDVCFPRARVALLVLCNEVFRRASPLQHGSVRGRFHQLLSYWLASPFDRAIAPGDTALVASPAPSDLGSPNHHHHQQQQQSQTDEDEDEEGEVVSVGSKTRLIEAYWRLQSVYFHGRFSSITSAQLADFSSLLGELTAAFDKTPATREGVLEPAVLSLPLSCASHARFAHLLRARSFRRVVLVQALLFLTSLTNSLSSSSSSSSSKSSEEVARSIAREELRVHELLDQFDGQPGNTSTVVLAALAHDSDWNILKDESRKDSAKRAKDSPEFFLPPVDIDALLSATKRRRTQSSSASSSSSLAAGSSDHNNNGNNSTNNQYGNAALTKLWTTKYKPLTHSSRQYQPSLSGFLKPLVDQLDPKAGIESEYLLSNDEVFAWRGLRFMLRENVSPFCRSVLPKFSDAVLEYFPEQKKAYGLQQAEEEEQQVQKAEEEEEKDKEGEDEKIKAMMGTADGDNVEEEGVVAVRDDEEDEGDGEREDDKADFDEAKLILDAEQVDVDDSDIVEADSETNADTGAEAGDDNETTGTTTTDDADGRESGVTGDETRDVADEEAAV